LKIVDTKSGIDVDEEVFSWIRHADTFLVFGSECYGEDTGEPACTYHALKYAQGMKKRVLLLRMIPWEGSFKHLAAEVLFAQNMLTLEWQPGVAMPASIVSGIVNAISCEETAPEFIGGQLCRSPSSMDVPSSHVIFGSMRFPAPPEARQLAVALQERGIQLKIIDMEAGGDIDKEVFSWIRFAETFMVFGCERYGEDTGNSACTYHELKYACGMKKRIVLLKMIPQTASFKHLAAQVLFKEKGTRTLSWTLGDPMPVTIVDEIVTATKLNTAHLQRKSIRTKKEVAATDADQGPTVEMRPKEFDHPESRSGFIFEDA